MRRHWFRGVVAAWFVASCLCAGNGTRAFADTRITFTTSDGVSIVGTYYEPSHRPAPGVLLLHAPTGTRENWRTVGERLASRGIAALAIDLRGYGDSGAAPVPEKTRDRSASARDVQAAIAWLKGRPESLGNIGIIGASLGATLGVIAAAEDASIRALVLLSPTLDFRGLRIQGPARKVTGRAVLVIASGEDGYASRSARQLVTDAPTWELRLLDGAGHGTTMLSRQPELVDTVVDWLSTRLL